MIRHYDMDGNPVDAMTGMSLFTSAPPIGHDVLVSDGGPVEVSTVFLSADHNHGEDGPPLIFQTLTSWNGDEVDCERWSTRAEAEQGHAAAVAKLRGTQ